MPGPPDRPAQAEPARGAPAAPGRAGHDALAVLAFLAGPVAFALDLSASYFLVPRVHAGGSRAPLHAVTLLALAVLAAGAAAALRVLRRPAGGAKRLEARVAARTRFLALGGLLLAAFFLGVLVAEALPALLLAPRD